MENDNVKIQNNKPLSELERGFGKYGSWALWDENGGIEKIINDDNFYDLIKPNIVFVGLNASMELPENWINYHSECCKFGKIKSWKQSHIRKLAEVLQEKEFEVLKGAYMTDIIKNHYDSNSGIIAEKIKQNESLTSKNIELFENELKILSEISKLDKFCIICIGNKSFDILDRISKYKINKIWHYSAYQLGWEGVKERIRRDLRGIICKII